MQPSNLPGPTRDGLFLLPPVHVSDSIEKNAGSDEEKFAFRPGAINRHHWKTHGQSENR
jgi:hypothetical protein